MAEAPPPEAEEVEEWVRCECGQHFVVSWKADCGGLGREPTEDDPPVFCPSCGREHRVVYAPLTTPVVRATSGDPVDEMFKDSGR
jgi:hypothetical protein